MISERAAPYWVVALNIVERNIKLFVVCVYLIFDISFDGGVLFRFYIWYGTLSCLIVFAKGNRNCVCLCVNILVFEEQRHAIEF